MAWIWNQRFGRNFDLLPRDLMSTRDESGLPRKRARKDMAAFLWWRVRRTFPGERSWSGCARSKPGDILPEGRVRRPGGGRKSGVEHQPDLPEKLEGLVEPLTRGDPESPLRWTCKSTRRLSLELAKLGYAASSRLVGALLHGMGYSLQGNRKTVEGKQHPDRNAQFEYINARVTRDARRPAGHFRGHQEEGAGRKLRQSRETVAQEGRSPKVNGHDFPDPSVPRAHPYGIYELTRNTRLRQCRNRPRHRDLCRGLHPGMVAGGRTARLSQGEATADHGRCGRQQRIATAPVEMGTATTGGRDCVFRSRSAIFRRAPANGTRLSTDCFRSSARTGEANL